MTIKKINSQSELEAVINADFQKVVDESSIPFGKYKNVSVEDVPNYYLDWMLAEGFLEGVYTYLLKPVEEEVKYREQFEIFIDGDECK